MNKSKTILVSLSLICGLAQMPAGNAQVAQIVVAGLRVLPQLLKPLTRGMKQNNQNSNQRNNQNNVQQANSTNGQQQTGDNDSQQGSNGKEATVIQSMHGNLVASRGPKSQSNAQQANKSSTPGASSQDQPDTNPAPFVMMTSP